MSYTHGILDAGVAHAEGNSGSCDRVRPRALMAAGRRCGWTYLRISSWSDERRMQG